MYMHYVLENKISVKLIFLKKASFPQENVNVKHSFSYASCLFNLFSRKYRPTSIDNFFTNKYCLYYYNIREYYSLVYHTIPFNYLLFMRCVHSLFASDAIMVAVLATGMETDIRQFFDKFGDFNLQTD